MTSTEQGDETVERLTLDEYDRELKRIYDLLHHRLGQQVDGETSRVAFEVLTQRAAIAGLFRGEGRGDPQPVEQT